MIHSAFAHVATKQLKRIQLLAQMLCYGLYIHSKRKKLITMLKIVLNTDKENTYKYMWCSTVRFVTKLLLLCL